LQGYEGAKAEEKENIIIPEDLIDHFINHAKNDNLGESRDVQHQYPASMLVPRCWPCM
jgi:hypothetical protein